MTYLRDAALRYAAELGWHLHPLRPDGKEPLLPNGVHGASNAATDIERWWTRWPTANIGVACGPNSVDVLDIDTKGDAQGRQLAERAHAAGLLTGWTAAVSTPSGGTHLWFPGTDQGGGAVGRRRDLELKSVGGYVLLPPSYVINRDDAGAVVFEGVYRMTHRRDGGHPIDWTAVKALLAPPRSVATFRDWVPADDTANFDGLIRRVAEQGARSGNRNSCLFWAACRAVEGGAPPTVYRDLVAAVVANGLTERDAWATVASAQRTTRRVAA